MTESHPGRRLHGPVRFEIHEFLPAPAERHCSMCRRIHGAAWMDFYKSLPRFEEARDSARREP